MKSIVIKFFLVSFVILLGIWSFGAYIPDGMTYSERIAHGLINGKKAWQKTGYLSAVPSKDVQSTVWLVGGEYKWPSSAVTMSIVSDNTGDTAAGAGAQIVNLTYLDSAWSEQSESITLNGTTPVTLAHTVYRVNNFRVASAGVSNYALGSIDIRALGGTPIYSRIGAGLTRARNSVYTVPAGKTLWVTGCSYWSGYTTAGKTERITLHATYNDVSEVLTSGIFYSYSEAILMDNGVAYTFPYPYKFPEKTDIKVSVYGEATAQILTTIRGHIDTN